ncbi:MAG: TetR family transcriptional regulator [Marmoricola sp.]|nr:TetR family transcriptional regulator [Marmoricola sp.]
MSTPVTTDEGMQTARTRDPERKQKILTAATELLARDGYAAVSMSDIGTRAGITGSGIYRHFESKAAILVVLFEQVIDNLLGDQQQTIHREPDLTVVLDLLIADQVQFVVSDRAIARVYHMEINNLPEEDRIRLRRKQRLYLEEWVHVVRELRPQLDDACARALVHAAIGAIQSTLFHNVGLPEERLRTVLAHSARATLLTAGA